MTDLAPEVGLPKVFPDSKWAALICTRDKNSNWTLVQTKPGNMISHSCTPDTKVELQVDKDYGLESNIVSSSIGRHRLILLENFINSAVDVQTGQKHVTTTNAYQALGKPFSFTPPLSATVTEPSKFNIFNLTSILFIATIILGSFIAYTGQGLPSTIFQFLLGIGIVGLVGSTYAIWTRKSHGPLFGIIVSAVILAAYSIGKIAAIGLTGLLDYTMIGLLITSVITAYLTHAKMKALIEKQWHPLDMPAYG
jgi:hypothetical protein